MYNMCVASDLFKDKMFYVDCIFRFGNKISNTVLSIPMFYGMTDDEINYVIEAINNKFVNGVDLVLGVGSGVINDLCKYVSFKHDLPYYIVATAPSMDGYASTGAAMIMGGMKVTYTTNSPTLI